MNEKCALRRVMAWRRRPEYLQGDQFSHALHRKNTAFTGVIVDGTYLLSASLSSQSAVSSSCVSTEGHCKTFHLQLLPYLHDFLDCGLLVYQIIQYLKPIKFTCDHTNFCTFKVNARHMNWSYAIKCNSKFHQNICESFLFFK
jgi:hypothetical protein